MEKNFKKALSHRRSYYHLSNLSPISKEQIEEILQYALKHVPSAFNSQSTRIVLLLAEHHHRLWNIVEETLRPNLSEEAFLRTQNKIQYSFASGFGTILFFEDTKVVKDLQENFPLYAENFPLWSEQTSAMHQLAVWTMLEDNGLGASLQHYNPLIDNTVKQNWQLPNTWRLVAQMPFGTPTAEPDEKSFQPLEGRLLVF